MSENRDLEEAKDNYDVENINTHFDDKPNDTDENINENSDDGDEIRNNFKQPESYSRRDRRPQTNFYVTSTENTAWMSRSRQVLNPLFLRK